MTFNRGRLMFFYIGGTGLVIILLAIIAKCCSLSMRISVIEERQDTEDEAGNFSY